MYQQEQCAGTAGQQITVTALGKPGPKLPGKVISVAGSALHLQVDEPLEVGAAVKAECNDTLMLGEVSHCQPAAGHYTVGVKLEHALLHTAELARLAARLLEGMPPDAALAERRDASELNPPAKS